MAKIWRYLELTKIAHLRNDGRELLGKYIYFTEKRDGSCLAIHFKLLSKYRRLINSIFRKEVSKYRVIVSSRNQEFADKSIKGDFYSCEDCMAVLRYLNDNPTRVVFGELLRKGLSPTRIENHGKKVEFIVFDIFTVIGSHFLSYQQVHQECYHYGIKCVQLFGEGRFTSMKSLLDYRDEMLEICKKEKREGVVLKTSHTNDDKPLYAKEKLDIATPRGHPKLERGTPQLPPLPFSEAISAVDKAYADLGTDFSYKGKAMPVVARYIQKEMEKHLCSKPEINFYNLYIQYCKDHHITVDETPKTRKTKKTPKTKPSIVSRIRSLFHI